MFFFGTCMYICERSRGQRSCLVTEWKYPGMYYHYGIRPSQIGSHFSPRLDRRHATRSGRFGLRRRRRRCYGKELPGSLNEKTSREIQEVQQEMTQFQFQSWLWIWGWGIFEALKTKNDESFFFSQLLFGLLPPPKMDPDSVWGE